MLGIVPLFLLFVSISVVLQNRFQEQEMMEQAQDAARTYAEIIRESLVNMMVNNLEVDESFLVRVNEIASFDTVHILVNDLKLRDEILTPKRAHRLETKYKTLQPHDDLEREVLASGEDQFARKGDTFRGVIPFTATNVCQKCHAVPVGYTLGAVDIHISLERVSLAASGNWERSLMIFLIFAGVAITVATLTFTRFVSRPIDRLVDATREISSGNLDYRAAGSGMGDSNRLSEDPSQDELAFLASKFDEMREALKEKIGQLDNLNNRLSERNIELEEALRQLRQAQEDLVRSERLAITGKLSAQLSHEINNPIHNIQSLLETSLRKINGNTQARELISVALEEVSRMARLTRQMLEFYRDSFVEVDHDVVDMRDLLVELEKSYKRPLARQRVDLVLVVPASLPCVLGSRDKLKQVFLNMILNSRDALPNGGRIMLRASSAQGSVRVDVIDTGIGIPEENLGKVFDAFYTTKREVSGVGLGLSVSYGIVQQHNGTIAVTSKLGEGTTFTVQLPSAGENRG